jgi:hypothetical protein
MQTALLFLILVILALAGILLILVLRKKPLRVYKPKGQYLLSAGEKRFFEALLNSIPPSLYICPKVRIADLIEVYLSPTNANYWKTLAPINQKHVDFVLVNRSDFSPRVAIELDGGSHKDQARERRDAFVDSVFASAGIPLLHVPVQGFYHYQTLRERITATLNTRG